MGRWPKLFTLTSGIAVAPGIYVSCAFWRRRSLSLFRSSDLLSPRASDALVACSSLAERASLGSAGDFDAGDVKVGDGFGRGGSSCCLRFLASSSSSATRLALAALIAALERNARSSRRVCVHHYECKPEVMEYCILELLTEDDGDGCCGDRDLEACCIMAASCSFCSL